MNKKAFVISLAVILGIAGIVLFSGEPSEADTSDNVFGWAYSENIGWISFNNTTGGGATSYGVNIETDGKFSGQAWSENIGWISFNESDLSGCPSGQCRAWVDTSDGKVYGWVRALAGGSPVAGGWDGWVHLRGGLIMGWR